MLLTHQLFREGCPFKLPSEFYRVKHFLGCFIRGENFSRTLPGLIKDVKLAAEDIFRNDPVYCSPIFLKLFIMIR
jgi:hypothetical protein